MTIDITPFKAATCYRQETFTDENAGRITRYTPVLADGSPDPVRQVFFKAETNVPLENGMQAQINAPIPGATTLEEAMAGFTATVAEQVKTLIENLKSEGLRQSLSQPVPRPPSRPLEFPGGLRTR